MQSLHSLLLEPLDSGHLFTMATTFVHTHFFVSADGPYIHSCLNISVTFTSP